MMSLGDFSTKELKEEIDRRATQPILDFARAIKYNPSLLDLLDQDEFWVTRDKEKVYIKSMEYTHAINVIKWLEDRAVTLKLQEDFRMTFSGPVCSGEAATDAFDDAHSMLLEQSAEEWLSEKPLMIALGNRVDSIFEEAIS